MDCLDDEGNGSLLVASELLDHPDRVSAGNKSSMARVNVLNTIHNIGNMTYYFIRAHPWSVQILTS